jgi:hypothetical protein
MFTTKKANLKREALDLMKAFEKLVKGYDFNRNSSEPS